MKTLATISLLVATLSHHPAFAQTRVIDGDTIDHQGRRIRIWGLDCPERDLPSTQAARNFIEGNHVILGELKGNSYGREVRIIYIQRTSRAEFFSFDFACAMISLGVCTEAVKFTQGKYERCKP